MSVEKRKEQGPRTTKKAQILSLYSSGMTSIPELAAITRSTTSYVAAVLHDAGHLKGYFDLYTTSSEPMNIYSRFFGGRLGFKDLETAKASVRLLDSFYRDFSESADRAGQHHSLTLALTMFDRARWCGKTAEADVFRNWLLERLSEDVASH